MGRGIKRRCCLRAGERREERSEKENNDESDLAFIKHLLCIRPRNLIKASTTLSEEDHQTRVGAEKEVWPRGPRLMRVTR